MVTAKLTEHTKSLLGPIHRALAYPTQFIGRLRNVLVGHFHHSALWGCSFEKYSPLERLYFIAWIIILTRLWYGRSKWTVHTALAAHHHSSESVLCPILSLSRVSFSRVVRQCKRRLACKWPRRVGRALIQGGDTVDYLFPSSNERLKRFLDNLPLNNWASRYLSVLAVHLLGRAPKITEKFNLLKFRYLAARIFRTRRPSPCFCTPNQTLSKKL